jgi:hypothetical protein
MRADDHAELLWTVNPDKGREVRDVEPVGIPRFGIGDVGKPLELRRDVGEALEFSGGECAGSGVNA